MKAGRVRPCVTGMGVITPVGQGLAAFWEGLMKGRNGSAPVRTFDTSNLKSHVGCEVGAFSLPDDVRPHVLGGRCTELALLAARQAVAHAGIEDRLSIDGHDAIAHLQVCFLSSGTCQDFSDDGTSVA